jgi:hypothetical protein
MIYELVVTSVPRGLQAGRSGFTTVQRTRGIHPDLCNRLEAASGYRHVLSPGDPRNPQIRSHAIVQTPAGQMCVLSRIIDAGNDYSGRSNKLAHHLAFDAAEVAARAKTSPAAVLLAAERAGLFLRQWAGDPREQPASPAVPSVPVEPGPCAAWSRVAGDAGWAGFIADRALRKEPTWIIAPPGVDLVELFAEALALVNYPQRWSISFTTYALTAGDGLWLGTVDGSPEAQAARGQQRIAVVDLVRRPPLTVQSPTIDAARGTGQVPWKRDVSRPAAAAPANAVAAGLPIGAPIEMPPAVAPLGPGGPPALGGPMAPPPMAGPPGAPPPTVNRLGGPPVTRGWGSGGDFDTLPTDDSPRSGFGVKAIAIAVAVLILAGLGGIAVFKPELGEKLVAMLGGDSSGKEEPSRKDPVKQGGANNELMSEGSTEPAGATEAVVTEPAAKEAAAKEAAAKEAAAKEAAAKEAAAKEAAAKEAAAKEAAAKETPEQMWAEFKKKLAGPNGRYPEASLHGDRGDGQKIRVCDVGKLKINLQLHGANSTFVDPLLNDKPYYLYSEPSGSEWKLSYKDAQNHSAYELGIARVDADGWLTVSLPARDTQKSPSIQLARQALACSALTIVSKDVEDREYVQLCRPNEYGPLVIEKFFANGRVWPKKNNHGDRLDAELPVPEVILPRNPWLFAVQPKDGSGVVLTRGDPAERGIKITHQSSEGDFGSSPGKANSCTLKMSVDGKDFWNPRIAFNRHGVDPLDALTVSVEASDLEGREGFAAYSRLGHLNKAPGQEHGEPNAHRVLVGPWCPLSAKKVIEFEKDQLSAVPKATMSSFVQAWLPANLFKGATARQAAILPIFKDDAFDKSRALKDWPEAFWQFVKKSREYVAWCGDPGPEPDPKKEEGKHKKWLQDRALFQARLAAGPKESRAFVQHMQEKHRDEDSKKKAAPLLAVCEAIEQLPRIEKEKRETHALLERMLEADLQIEGQLVVWAPQLDKQPCVLATFAAGDRRKPVVIKAKVASKPGPEAGRTEPDVQHDQPASPETASTP